MQTRQGLGGQGPHQAIIQLKVVLVTAAPVLREELAGLNNTALIAPARGPPNNVDAVSGLLQPLPGNAMS
ncbi:hypothetical protein ACWC9R_15375 [Streptomyces sp. NPDC001219]